MKTNERNDNPCLSCIDRLKYRDLQTSFIPDSPVSFVLAIRYPPGSQISSQVLIDNLTLTAPLLRVTAGRVGCLPTLAFDTMSHHRASPPYLPVPQNDTSPERLPLSSNDEVRLPILCQL
jgi:hypothetical protein